jgi:type IV secretory pathway VirJ component
MNRRVLAPLAIVAFLTGAATPATQATPAAAPAGETLTYGRFGVVAVVRQVPHPGHVVVFFSGDGGWNLGVVDMARTLAGMDALVLGVNVPRYLKMLAAGKEKCSYPASDVELLSKYAQKKLGFPAYTPPVLVGYSSGATLAYALLVQAPPNTFKGAISMGFCPDLPVTKPFCAGNGLTWGPGPKGKGVSFNPTTRLEQPWVAFQGLIDQVCSPADVQAFVRQVKNGEAVMLPKVGHGFSVPTHWEAELKAAFQRIGGGTGGGESTANPQSLPSPGSPPSSGTPPDTGRGAASVLAGPHGAPPSGAAAPTPGAPPAAQVPSLTDLPVIEMPAKQPAGALLALIVSGDGGWAGIDREVANDLAAKGVPVVGLDSLQYFWTARTPEGAAADLQRIARHYLAAWSRQQLLLIGYSLGADVLPFMANRLPADLQQRIRLIALLGPSRRTSFEFHVSDWLGSGNPGDRAVLPEVAKLRGKPILCLYGQEEEDSLCTQIGTLGKAVAFQGSHHFNGAYATLADRILHEAQTAGAAR